MAFETVSLNQSHGVQTKAAEVLGIDTSAALALPGVVAVFTAAELNGGAKEQWHTSIGPQSPETPRPPLADREVRFVGDVVSEVDH